MGGTHQRKIVALLNSSENRSISPSQTSDDHPSFKLSGSSQALYHTFAVCSLSDSKHLKRYYDSITHLKSLSRIGGSEVLIFPHDHPD